MIQAIRRDIGLVLITLAVGVVCTELAHRSFSENPHGGADPADPRFVAVGRVYKAELGKAYASAIIAGAADLDAGKPVSVTIEAIGHNWDQNRRDLFDHLVAPGLDGILPEGTPTKRSQLASELR